MPKRLGITLDKFNKVKDQERKRHKKTFTDFEINVPVVNKELFEGKVKKTFYTPLFDIHIAKYEGIPNKIKTIHARMLENFEKEVCDMTYICSPKTIYLIIVPLLKPGYVKTEKYRCVGLIEVNDDCIQWCWIHPFFRGKGIMKTLFIWYGKNEGCLNLQPPITDSMQRLMDSYEKSGKTDLELKEKQTQFYREYLLKKYPDMKDRISHLEKKGVLKVRESQAILEALKHQGDENISDEMYDISMKVCIETHYHIQTHPEDEDAIMKFGEEMALDENVVKKAMQSFKDFGCKKV